MDHLKIPQQQFEIAEKAIINGDTYQLAHFLDAYKEYPQLRQWYGGVGPYSITEKDFHENAQAIIARQHELNNWSEFEKFKKELSRKDSMISLFEIAADAIVSGNEATLKQMLQQHPDLINSRSMRSHHATLLHYIGANGIEGFRQITPKNAVRIAGILLDAGAVVDAMGDMYEGSTTFGLVATSIHPRKGQVFKKILLTSC